MTGPFAVAFAAPGGKYAVFELNVPARKFQTLGFGRTVLANVN
ncbi:MAG TPA: hypothetical protein VKB56_01645 [Terriglobales bacterium]|nr:hypothetical protein [Terriglobales bacterium]